MSTENLIAATGILQDAQKELEQAHKDLINHNIDLHAHQDLRDLIAERFSGDAIYTWRRYYLYLAGGYYTSQRYSFTSQRYFYIWQMSAGTMLGAYFSFMASRQAALSNPGSATTSAYRVISLVAVSYFM